MRAEHQGASAPKWGADPGRGARKPQGRARGPREGRGETPGKGWEIPPRRAQRPQEQSMKTPGWKRGDAPGAVHRDPKEGLGDPPTGHRDPVRRAQRPQGRAGRPRNRARRPRAGARRGGDALRADAARSADSRSREALRRAGCAAGARPGPPRSALGLRLLRPAAARGCRPSVSLRLRQRQPRARSPGVRPGLGAAPARPGSAAGWPDGASEEGRTQGARGQRGGRAPAPEQVRGGAVARGLGGGGARGGRGPGGGRSLLWAGPPCGCGHVGGAFWEGGLHSPVAAGARGPRGQLGLGGGGAEWTGDPRRIPSLTPLPHAFRGLHAGLPLGAGGSHASLCEAFFSGIP